jgi:hypothetical protein
MAMWRRVWAWFAMGIPVACGSDPAPPPPASAVVELVHVVGDAGTTGTRFCVFVSRGETTPAGGRTCSEPREFRLFPDDDGGEPRHCISRSSSEAGSSRLPASATGGLQDLVEDPDKARELVEGAVAEIERALAPRGKKISAAAILGTSGFRDEAGRIVEGRYDGLFRSVAQVFEMRQVPVVTRTLRPEEEARFSWTTIRFLHLHNDAFSVIETGGGGCHFATGKSDAEYADVTSASDPIGTSRAWQTYAADDVRAAEITALKEPLFKPCYSGSSADPTGQDAAACVAFLRARLFDGSAIARAAAEVRPEGRPLYGMGALTADDIHAAAVDECARPQKDARGYIKHQSCFALAFQEAFLRTAAGDGGVVRNGVESWPRGASISPGGEFPACKDSTIQIAIDPGPEPQL